MKFISPWLDDNFTHVFKVWQNSDGYFTKSVNEFLTRKILVYARCVVFSESETPSAGRKFMECHPGSIWLNIGTRLATEPTVGGLPETYLCLSYCHKAIRVAYASECWPIRLRVSSSRHGRPRERWSLKIEMKTSVGGRHSGGIWKDFLRGYHPHTGEVSDLEVVRLCPV